MLRYYRCHRLVARLRFIRRLRCRSYRLIRRYLRRHLMLRYHRCHRLVARLRFIRRLRCRSYRLVRRYLRRRLMLRNYRCHRLVARLRFIRRLRCRSYRLIRRYLRQQLLPRYCRCFRFIVGSPVPHNILICANGCIHLVRRDMLHCTVMIAVQQLFAALTAIFFSVTDFRSAKTAKHH